MFIAFSHQLTPAQIEDATSTMGVTSIVNLKDVSPELQTVFSQVPATATLTDLQKLANDIVAVAKANDCSIFFCTGESTVAMWANIYASDFQQAVGELIGLDMGHECPNHTPLCSPALGMYCVTSTTERKSVEVTNPDGTVTKTAVFQHIQWRGMFDYKRTYDPITRKSWASIFGWQ